MKKLLSLILIMTFLGTAQASVGNGLKAAFNEYYHSMTVEWDQQDSHKKKLIEEKLLVALMNLKEQGMNQEDLFTFLQSETGGREFGIQLRKRLELSNLNEMTRSEALAFYNDIIKNSYQTGANWSGLNTATSVVFVVVGAAILTTLGLWVAGVVDCHQEEYCFDPWDCERQTICE